MKEKSTQSRKGVKGQLPLAESRGSASGRVWGNAPIVPRTTNSKRKLKQGAGSEASLPVTLRFLRSAPQAAPSNTCAVSRQMGVTEGHGNRRSLRLPSGSCTIEKLSLFTTKKAALQCFHEQRKEPLWSQDQLCGRAHLARHCTVGR